MSRYVREPDQREELEAMERQYERSIDGPRPVEYGNGVQVGSRLPLIDEDTRRPLNERRPASTEGSAPN